jgi:arylsulfatase A-like enzyme
MSDQNFLLISVDSLRHDFCSFLNNSEETMDFLEDLAAESTVFERAISPSVWTLPVHTSIFTGPYPAEHQVNDEQTVLGDHPTFAEILSENGYETRSFTHNGWFKSGGLTRGFDHDHTRMPGMVGYSVSNFRKGVDERDRRKFVNGAKQVLEAPVVKGQKMFFRYRYKGLRTVKNCFRRLEKRDSPFCYMVHLNDVRHVYRPHIKYYREVGERGIRELHENVRYQETLKDNRHEIYTGRYEIDQDRLDLTKDLYGASILQVDALIERLIDRLKSLGEYENTVMIFFRDHGDLIGENEMCGHSYSLADELIRVPLLVHGLTGQLEKGWRRDVVQLNDLYPTILKMAGLDAPETNSISLLDESRESAFVHLLESTDNIKFRVSDYYPFEQYAIWQSPSSKLVYAPEEDGRELDSDGKSTLAEELNEHLKGLMKIPSRGESELASSTRSQLENMGYL